MCIFSGRVSQVSSTRIFARTLPGDRQVLVYSMNVTIDETLAMVLPIPVVPGSTDDAIELVDLSRCPKFFDRLERAFDMPRASGPMAPLSISHRPKLQVHKVGAFVASFVPSPRDFDRLDPRFRMPAPVLAQRQEYADWGFVVFQLAPKTGVQTVHPMAFTFPTRRPRSLFFPTLHVHGDDAVPEHAAFDHTFLCQLSQVTDPVLAQTLPWQTSWKRAGKFMSARRAKHLIAPRDPARRTRLYGTRANADTWIDPPPCAGPQVLTGCGERFSFELHASAAYSTTNVEPQHSRWRDTARTRIDDLHAGMVAGLAKLTTDNADAWQLGPVEQPKQSLWARIRGDEIPPLWMSNGQLQSYCQPGESGFITEGTLGPFALEIDASTERVEAQRVRFVFRAAPSIERIDEIRRAIAEILDRAIA